jgi:hypothetical protein
VRNTLKSGKDTCASAKSIRKTLPNQSQLSEGGEKNRKKKKRKEKKVCKENSNGEVSGRTQRQTAPKTYLSLRLPLPKKVEAL